MVYFSVIAQKKLELLQLIQFTTTMYQSSSKMIKRLNPILYGFSKALAFIAITEKKLARRSIISFSFCLWIFFSFLSFLLTSKRLFYSQSSLQNTKFFSDFISNLRLHSGFFPSPCRKGNTTRWASLWGGPQHLPLQPKMEISSLVAHEKIYMPTSPWHVPYFSFSNVFIIMSAPFLYLWTFLSYNFFSSSTSHIQWYQI